MVIRVLSLGADVDSDVEVSVSIVVNEFERVNEADDVRAVDDAVGVVYDGDE